MDAPALDMDALLTASQIKTLTGVRSLQVVSNWRRRGLLPVAVDDTGTPVKDSRGRPLYRLRDAARVDAAMHARAEAMARNLLTCRAA